MPPITINPLVSSLAASLTEMVPPNVVLHHVLNPVSPETSIVYPEAAEKYFLALGDLQNAAFSRRIRVENRMRIAFDLLFDRSLFDLVEEVQNAWIDRKNPPSDEPPHQADDYESVAGAFHLAVSDAESLTEPGEELTALLDLARTFQESIGTLPNLQSWTARALARLCPDDAPAETHEVSLIVLGARLLWKMEILRGTALSLGKAASLLKTAGKHREEGFVRYARAIVLLLHSDSDVDPLYGALRELEEAILCFRRSRSDFPHILYKRISETHERLGRSHHSQGNMRSAGFHFTQARAFERPIGPARLPIARVVASRPKRHWGAALKSLLGMG